MSWCPCCSKQDVDTNAEFEDLKKKCEALQLENRQISVKIVKYEREKEQLRKQSMEIEIVAKTPYETTIEEIITHLDKNKNGKIDLEEFKELYPKGHAIFDHVDLNHDGEIDQEEFKKFIGSQKLATRMLNRLKKSTMKNIMTILENDETGTIKLQDFKSLYPEKPDSFFDNFDVNQDGHVTRKEFEAFIKTENLTTDMLNRLSTISFGSMELNDTAQKTRDESMEDKITIQPSLASERESIEDQIMIQPE